jgi:diguanylate cyclase (GGDEF)-like protein
MIRLTRKVFSDLTLWMIFFGLLMGLFFPFFMVAMGVPSSLVLTPFFFAACMAAGFIVGSFNIALARTVVGRRLQELTKRMQLVESNLNQMAGGSDLSKCTPEACSIQIDSEDEIGENAKAFNRLVDALAASHRTNAAVLTFNEMLTSQLNLDVLTNQALLQLIENTNSSAGAILIEAEGEMHLSASHGIRSPEKIPGSDYLRRAVRTEQRQIVHLPEEVTLEGVLTDFRPREVIVDPISYKHIPLGVVVLANPQTYSDEAKNRLNLFHQGLSLALNNALVHDRLQRLAAIDPLTGIYNRRFGLARLKEEFNRAVRQTTPLGVMMFDIDHFKRVNDTYGHLIGDRILVRISAVTRAVMREGDVLLRYGGEEFLAVLPAASKEDLRKVGERLRRMVEETTVTDGDQVIQVTISIGGTAYPEFDAAESLKLVEQADQALYIAKDSGRNRVIVP